MGELVTSLKILEWLFELKEIGVFSLFLDLSSPNFCTRPPIPQQFLPTSPDNGAAASVINFNVNVVLKYASIIHTYLYFPSVSVL